MKLVHVCLSAAVIAGCGGAARARDTTEGPAPAAAGDARPASRDEADERAPTLADALAPLRPAGAEAVLGPLTAGPADASAHARAAVFYGDTRSGGMTLLWGLTHAALGGSDPAVGEAMGRVLRGRISVRREGTTTHIATQLAPGSMPAVVADDGSLTAPVAHLFEGLFAASCARFDGTWTLASATEAFAFFVGLSSAQPMLEPHVELMPWLRALAAAGHLEGLVAGLLAPAFPGEIPDAARVGAARAYVAAHPFVPTHAALPDDFIPFRPGG